jgi:fatty-acyl-CoA synthase
MSLRMADGARTARVTPVPHAAPAVPAENLVDHLRHWARWQPGRAAVRFEGRTVTWAELDHATDRLAAGLAARGAGAGDPVAILMGNRPEYVEAMLAILKLGAVVVPLNTRWTATELLHPLEDCGARLVMTEASTAETIEAAIRRLAGVRLVGADPVEGMSSFADLRGSGGPAPTRRITADDPAFVCYTSGTTGFPKGAVLSHGAIRAGGVAKVLAEGITFRDRLLIPVPLAFTGSCISLFMQMGLVPGATSVIERQFDAHRCLELVESERISMMTGVPVVFESMLRHPRIDSIDLSSLWSLTSGGAPVSLELLRAWQARGVRMTQAYGLTEASGGCVYLHADDAERKCGFAGLPMLHTEIRVVDADGHQLAPGEIGEILVRGPSVMRGYLNRPEETAAAIVDGWLHTGDLGALDEEGFLRVVDRAKDMFVSGGINVYPAEIERALGALHGVTEMAVIGVPDARWGEVPMLVVAGGATVDREQLAAICAGELADYKRPRYLVEHGAPLPRTLGGKVMKRELRERYRDLPPGVVDLKRPVC